MDLLHRLLSSDGFMPHGCCYLWDSRIIWLHVISDGLIALAYYSIPLTLVYFVTRRKDLAFDWIFLCFAVFIVACGTTHALEIINVWHPIYWLAGIIKAFTAATSIVTAILLVRLVPKALALPSPEQLRLANRELQREVGERTEAVQRIEALNEELRTRTAQLEAANQELETFSYSVSHDLRAPLRHIDGYLELLREHPEDVGPRRNYMKIIADSTHEMSLLIEHLLQFSRVGRTALRPGPIDCAEMISQVRRELVRENAGRDITWNIGPLPEVWADPVLLRQVWTNLLSNAVKYTSRRAQAEITISCRETPEEFEFSIQDNGAGFDMQYADKLFGVFQRLHGREEFEGTGIGLAHVRRIVARHGGRTWAEGRLDAGATFHFTLPKSGPG